MTEGVLQHTSSLALYMNKRIESDAVKTYFWAHENLSFFHSTNSLGTHSIPVNSLVVWLYAALFYNQSSGAK